MTGLPPVLSRLREISVELGELHRELAQVELAAEGARTQVWRSGEQGQSVTAMREQGRAHAAEFSMDGIKIKGEIQSLCCERDFLMACVQVGVLDV